ncbi:MAG: G1 family endopeptidase, partial [Thermaerobacter sp.]|nr:G1 family endopeptidase [Thermaerobacter sp.]
QGAAAGYWAARAAAGDMGTPDGEGPTFDARTLPVAVFAEPEYARVGAVPADQSITLAVGLKLAHPNALRSLLAAQRASGSGFVTAQQFADRFGPSVGAYQAVVSFLQGQGFQVSTSPNRLLMTARGTVAQAEAAFAVNLASYRYEGGVYRAPTATPQIPASLSGIIQSVAGLDNFPVFKPQLSRLNLPLGAAVANSVYYGSDGYTPLGIRTAYDVPSGAGAPTGAGQSVDIVIWDAVSPADVAGFDAAYGLPPAVINQYPVAGTPVVHFKDATPEADIDAEWAHTIAPAATINIYEAANSGFAQLEEALNEAVVQHAANVLNMSWGAPEDLMPVSILGSYDAVMAQGAAEGMTLVAAAGDNGAYTDGTNLSVSYPASDPYVLAAGGTTLQINADGTYRSEATWNGLENPGGCPTTITPTPPPFGYCGDRAHPPYYDGGGGGFSSAFSAPGYQAATVDNYVYGGKDYNPSDMRGLPDVALNAGALTAGYVKGSLGGYIGTSLAAPTWSGIIALADQERSAAGLPPLGNLMPFLYEAPLAVSQPAPSAATPTLPLHDVTVGDNNALAATGPYYAAAGWDPATGWGSPDVAALLSDLAGLSLPASITLSPTALVPDYPAGTTITVQGVDTHFAAGTTVALTEAGVAVTGAVSNVSVVSPSKLTFQLVGGLPQAFYDVAVSDTTDGTLTAPLEIGTESMAISPTQVAVGYGATDIAITGDNTDFVSGSLTAQVVQAGNLEQVTQPAAVTVTGPTAASYALPLGLPAGSYDIVAYDENDGVALLAPFQVVGVSAVSVGASPASVPANGTAASTITAKVYGAGGAPLAGVTVGFATTLGTLSATSATTDAQGQAQVSLASTAAGTATVTATAQGVSGTAQVAFTPVVSKVSVTASPTSVPANGTAASGITATVTDAAGAPLAGVTVDFATTLGTLSATSATTDAQGQAQVSLTSTAAGPATVTGSAQGVSGTAQVTFTPVVSKVSVTASPSSVPANGTAASGITATVTDAAGAPLSGITVDFTTTLGTLSAASATTNAQGQAQVSLTSTAAGTATVTATAQGVSGTAQVTFTSAVQIAPNVKYLVLRRSENWAGLVVGRPGDTAVSAQWKIPAAPATSGSYVAQAVGIGGFQTSDLLAVGTQEQGLQGQASYVAFWETAPGNETAIGSVPVRRGDQVAASLSEVSPGQWKITLRDLTSGQTFTQVVSYDSSRSSAEILLADPSQGGSILPLGDFGRLVFSHGKVTRNGTTLPILLAGALPVEMVNPASKTLEVRIVPLIDRGVGAFEAVYLAPGTPAAAQR